MNYFNCYYLILSDDLIGFWIWIDFLFLNLTRDQIELVIIIIQRLINWFNVNSRSNNFIFISSGLSWDIYHLLKIKLLFNSKLFQLVYFFSLKKKRKVAYLMRRSKVKEVRERTESGSAGEAHEGIYLQRQYNSTPSIHFAFSCLIIFPLPTCPIFLIF